MVSTTAYTDLYLFILSISVHSTVIASSLYTANFNKKYAFEKFENLETFDEKLTTIEALGQSISKLFGIGVDSFVPVDLSRMPKFLCLVGQNLVDSRVTVAN